MSRVKNMSRGGWIVVGILVAMLLVPSGVAAARTAYQGIIGTSGNKADVTPAQQLLTTEASPTKYEDYEAGVASAVGRYDCTSVSGPIPAGEAFVAQQVDLDIDLADSPAGYSGGPNGGHVSESEFTLYAETPSVGCGYGSSIMSGEAPDGNVGNVTIPFVPGVIVPSGYSIDISVFGMDAAIYVTGYVVPSADAPSTPQAVKNGKMTLPHIP